jgi:transcriptional regulator with XRE-family HTH domain
MEVPGVPKKRYDDEALRARALELRSKGLSYREIARELGCSVFKVHQLISSYESPRSRIREVHELATRVEELNRKLRDIEGLASRLEVAVKPPAFNIEPDLRLLCIAAEIRFNVRPCKYMDSDWHCTLYCVFDRIEGLDGRKVIERGDECYQPNVITHWLFCLICPDYTPAEDGEVKRILGDRLGQVECINGRLVLRGPEESNP